MSAEDTIAAISTPIGKAGIGIIRISGPLALSIAKTIFKPKRKIKEFESHRLYLGNLIDPKTNRTIDEVLLCYMKAPHSYTREDVVEINSHSGYMVLSKILELVLSQGARLAKPGEFTLRAFLNGRIDLTQAEAIVDLINAQSETGLYLASQQLKGSLKDKINQLKEKVADLLAHVEVAIDFPEEEEAFISKEDMVSKLNQLISEIEAIIRLHRQKKVWIDGINTIIVGKVNAGKSSLLNRLLDEERAIVSPIPGTTRDIIESSILINGLPLRLVDTAGIRDVADEIERKGIFFAKKRLKEADLVLIVIDQSKALSKEDLEIIEMCKEKSSVLVLNKIDLPSGLKEEDFNKLLSYGFPVVKISALTGEGLEDLKKTIFDMAIKGEKDLLESSIAPNLRHKQALESCLDSLKNASNLLKEDGTIDLIAFEIKNALDSLGQITGEVTTEDILEKIFSQFCLGK
ncbi:MAG: tRNA uridine-5-carboxymethylaminomethyl(34) synthesis GTPase MnmE [Deltaproteobacteria bacterium]|nr:MAG: tRNA uridine-5-carboxymethylaminomethyl(34) synthesis GTPase MnmE [Deltaproteobacteria bacterium]